jgi:hypothetical protein
MSENIVSFSGGKDSTAMLHMMLERGEKIRAVVFFDTGWEFDEMLEHIDRVEQNTGIKIVRLKPEKPFDYWFSEHVKKRNFKYKIGRSWPGNLSRWCTGIKLKTIEEWRNNVDFDYDFECVGIAVGEERRAKNKPKKRYPLIEYGVTEREALLYCKKLGYDWGGLYDVLDRVSCFCCPLQNRLTLINLRKFLPKYWARIEAMAAKTPERYFKDKMTFDEYVKAKIKRGNE